MSSTVGEAYIEVNADDSRLTAQVKEAARRAAEAAKAKVKFDADLDARKVAAEAKAAAARASREATVRFDSDADFSSIIAEAKLAAAAAKTRVEVEVILNKKGFARGSDGIFRDLEGQALSAQDAIQHVADSLQEIKPPGGGGGGGLVSSALDGIASAGGRAGVGIAAVVAAVEILLPYVVAVGGGIIALAGQLAYASAQAIPLATNLAAIGLAAVATVVATRGLGDAFKAASKQQDAQNASNVKTKAGQEALKKATDEYKASLDNLPASAQGFVTAITGLGGAFRGLRRDVQDEFFKGLGDQITDTAKRALPVLRSGLVQTAGVINEGAQGLLKWAGSKQGLQQISNIFSGLNGILRPLISAIGSFGGGILTILEGALGPGKDLAQSIADIGDSFSTWASGFVSSGGLADLLQKASDAGGDLWAILKNVGSILGSLFSGSSDLGQGLLESLKRITKGFADMLKTPEGQAKMADFFQKAGEDLGGIADALRVAVPAFVTFVQVLQRGSDGFNKLLGAVQPIAGPLGKVIGLLSTGGIPAIGSIIDGIASAFSALGGVDWAGIVSGVGGFFTSLGDAGGGAASGIGGFFSGLVDSASGLAGKIIAGAGDIVGSFTTWLSGVPAAVGGFVDGIVQFFVGLPDKIIAAAGDLASAFGTWLAGLPVAAINGITAFLVSFADLAGRVITQAGDIAGAFTQWLADLPTAAIYGIATLIGTFVGLGIRLFAAAGDAAAAFGSWVAGIPGRAAQLVGQIGGALAGLAGRMIAGAGNIAAAFGAWVSALPGRAAALARQIASSLAGLASRMIAAAGSLASSFGSWVSAIPGRAAAIARQIVSSFSGLAGKMVSAAGSLVSRITSWASGVASAGQRAASRLVDAFRGLAGRIVSAIGTIVPHISMPNISGIVGRIKSAVQNAATPNAKGSVVDSPTFALIGEAGPEAVIPLSPGAKMDPDVVNLLRNVAAREGLAPEATAAKAGQARPIDVHVTMPTDDPEAAAMAVVNRLVLELAA